jgi:ABC-2 type transport system permease protein
MSTYTVARDDFRNAAGSYAVIGVVGVFAALVGLIFAAEMNTFDDPYRTLFDVQIFVAYVFPLVVAPVTYLCIAGDRVSGSITFAMGLPNSRREYLSGKFLSRFGVVAAAVVVGTLVGLGVAVVTFTNPPDVERFLVFAGVTLVYACSWVSVFVAISAATKKRSRAMLGILIAYFVLVPFWFGMAGIGLETVINAVADLLGTTVTESAKNYIRSLSPAYAYFGGMQPVYAGVVDQYSVIQANYGETSNALSRQPWYNVLVMLGWSAVSLAVGFLKFRTSELM